MFNFADIAKTQLADIERPANPPVGTYVFQITKVPEISTSADGKWDTVTFSVVAVSATDNVDPESLTEFGALKNIRSQVRFMFNKEDKTAAEGTLFRLRQFLENHVKCAEDRMSLTESLNASVNRQFLGDLAWRPDKTNPEIIYTEIKKTAAVD